MFEQKTGYRIQDTGKNGLQGKLPDELGVRERSSLTTKKTGYGIRDTGKIKFGGKLRHRFDVGTKRALAFGALIGLLMFAAPGCARQKTKPMLEYMPNMAHSPAVKAQEAGGMFVPVAGTVPRGVEYYPYQIGDTLKAAELRNPLPATLEVLQAGRKSFNTFCIVCHGAKGDGKGYIIPKFPQPPSLLTDRVRNWPDGRIFHIITRGQQTMPSYAHQLEAAQRWAVVHYIRVLERAARPTPEDLAQMQALGLDFSGDEPDTAAPKLWPDR